MDLLHLRCLLTAAVISFLSIGVSAQLGADPGIKDLSKFDRKRPLSNDLQTTAVGANEILGPTRVDLRNRRVELRCVGGKRTHTT